MSAGYDPESAVALLEELCIATAPLENLFNEVCQMLEGQIDDEDLRTVDRVGSVAGDLWNPLAKLREKYSDRTKRIVEEEEEGLGER